MEKTEKEWRKIVLLARYNSLRSDVNSQETNNDNILKVEDILEKEYDLSQKDLEEQLQQYKKDVLPQKEAIIKQRAKEIMSDIARELNEIRTDDSFSTADNREIFHRIQEILAMDGDIANEALQEAEKKANITHTMFHQTNLNGDNLGGHVYYFSFDK